MHQIFCVPPVNIWKISPIHLNNFEKEVIDMHYDPMTPVDNILKNIEDLIEYG